MFLYFFHAVYKLIAWKILRNFPDAAAFGIGFQIGGARVYLVPTT